MSFIIAHRGASFHAPENTLSAFREAYSLGADGIETDVHFTLDGNLVIHHSYTIDGCSNGHGAVEQMTLAQLKTYDFGSYKGVRWIGESIPTLDECLEVSKDFAFVNIELKAPFNRSVSQVKAVTDIVCAHGMTDRVVISAFDHSMLKEVKEYCPDLRVGLLTMPSGFFRNRLFSLLVTYLPQDKRLIEITRADLPLIPNGVLDPDQIGIPSPDIPTAIVELAHQIGAVYPFYALSQAMVQLDKQVDLVNYITNLDFKPDYLHCHYSCVLRRPELVKEFSDIGIGVNPWTPDEPEDLKRLSQLGCHSIITNRPDTLAQIQNKAQIHCK